MSRRVTCARNLREALKAALPLALLCLEACGGRASEPAGVASGALNNPSGTCTAPDSGARPGFHAPQRGDHWLPDCQNPLRREYWRVFARSEESAYVMPRPDAAVEAACTEQAHALREIVRQEGLCELAGTAFVQQINDLHPARALQITRYMHEQLQFVAEEIGITPPPLPSDILDACALEEQPTAELTELCERERDRLASGHDIGFSYEGRGAEELVHLLNRLYGVGEPAE